MQTRKFTDSLGTKPPKLCWADELNQRTQNTIQMKMPVQMK